jgi:hypothetical protein
LGEYGLAFIYAPTPFINTALFTLTYDFGNALKLLLLFITLKQMARCQWFFVIYRAFYHSFNELFLSCLEGFIKKVTIKSTQWRYLIAWFY